MRRKDMPNDILVMLKTTLVTNLFAGGLLSLIIFLIFKEYAYAFAIGLMIGELNLLISTTITNLLLTEKGGKYASNYFMSFILRVSFIAIIGFVFFTYNMYSSGAYMIGYSAHFIGIVAYSHGINNKGKGSD
jgi:ATP synthase protein I